MQQIIKETYLSQKPRNGAMTVAILSVQVLLAGSIVYWADAAHSRSWMQLEPRALFEKYEFWRTVTSILAHADFKHFLANALPFAFFSYLLYGYFGYAIYPVSTLIASAVAGYVTLFFYPPDSSLVGASGMVYCMAGFWLSIFLFVEKRHSVSKRLLRSLGFVFIMLIPDTYEPSVSYVSHAAGFFAGVLLAGVYYFRNREMFQRAQVVELESDEDQQYTVH